MGCCANYLWRTARLESLEVARPRLRTFNSEYIGNIKTVHPRSWLHALQTCQTGPYKDMPVWKVCIMRGRYRTHSPDAFYILLLNFRKILSAQFPNFPVRRIWFYASLAHTKLISRRTICLSDWRWSKP